MSMYQMTLVVTIVARSENGIIITTSVLWSFTANFNTVFRCLVHNISCTLPAQQQTDS